MCKIRISEIVLVALALVLSGVIILFSVAERSAAVPIGVAGQNISSAAPTETGSPLPADVVQAATPSRTSPADGAGCGSATANTHPADAKTPPTADPVGDIININTASAEELMSLSGIGEKLSERIIAYREQNGPFRTIEEIMNVSGIGEGKFSAIKDRIVVG